MHIMAWGYDLGFSMCGAYSDGEVETYADVLVK